MKLLRKTRKKAACYLSVLVIAKNTVRYFIFFLVEGSCLLTQCYESIEMGTFLTFERMRVSDALGEKLKRKMPACYIGTIHPG